MTRQRLAILALGLVWGGYLLQLASPLRTNTDATVFLDLAASASDGNGFLVEGKPTHFPVGYPLIIAALDRAGLACSASFIALNLLALAVGLAATAYVLRRSLGLGTTSLWTVALCSMLCWVFIKHVTLPLSDLPYFGLAQSCLAAVTWSGDRRGRARLLALAIAALLAAAAIAVRTVGIALLPVVCFACLPATASASQWCDRVVDKLGLSRATVITLLVTGLAPIVCVVVLRTRYFHEFVEMWQESMGPLEVTRAKLNDWGELIVNTSAAKLPAALRGVVALLGLLVPILMVAAARLRQRLAPVDVYTLSYLAILLVWPYQDARFWMPVFPIFLGAIALVWERHARSLAVRRLGVAYLAGFSLLGVVALAYSTWISLAQSQFPDRFAGGVYRDTYHAAWSVDAARADRRSQVDPQILRLVQRYSSPPR